MCILTPPRTLSTCEAATLGDARHGDLSDPKKIIMKSRVSWGLESAEQKKRELVNSDGDNLHPLQHADDVSEHYMVFRAADRAPDLPVAGTSTVFTFNEEPQVGPLLLGDIPALHFTDVPPKYSLEPVG